MYLQYSKISKEYTAQANEDPNRLKFVVKGCKMKERKKSCCPSIPSLLSSSRHQGN